MGEVPVWKALCNIAFSIIKLKVDKGKGRFEIDVGLRKSRFECGRVLCYVLCAEIAESAV